MALVSPSRARCVCECLSLTGLQPVSFCSRGSVFVVEPFRQSVVWRKEFGQFPSCLARVKCVFRAILLDADWPAVKMLAAAAGPVRGWSGQRPVRVLVGKLCRRHHQKQSP